MQAERALSIVGPGGGRRVMLGPLLGVEFKFWGEDTDGALSVVEHPFAVGALVPPHTHTREDEFSIVTEGRIGFRSGDQEVVLGPGSYITKPRNQLHSMWNAGDGPGRIIEIISPAGFERYFEEVAELFEAEAGPDMSAIGELAASYGLSFDMSWVPDLVERYALTPML